jgi:hypothetical protein
VIVADTRPHNLAELLWAVIENYWWLLLFAGGGIAAGTRQLVDAVSHRIANGGRKPLPSKHYERELTRRDREVIRLRALLAEVAELDSINDPLDPRAITLPSKLSKEIAAAVGEEPATTSITSRK